MRDSSGSPQARGSQPLKGAVPWGLALVMAIGWFLSVRKEPPAPPAGHDRTIGSNDRTPRADDVEPAYADKRVRLSRKATTPPLEAADLGAHNGIRLYRDSDEGLFFVFDAERGAPPDKPANGVFLVPCADGEFQLVEVRNGRKHGVEVHKTGEDAGTLRVSHYANGQKHGRETIYDLEHVGQFEDTYFEKGKTVRTQPSPDK